MQLNTIQTIKTDARIVFVGPAPSEGVCFQALKLAVYKKDDLARYLENFNEDILECDQRGQVDMDYSTYISADSRKSVDASGKILFLSLRANKEALELYGKNNNLKEIEFFVDHEKRFNPKVVGFRLIAEGGL